MTRGPTTPRSTVRIRRAVLAGGLLVLALWLLLRDSPPVADETGMRAVAPGTQSAPSPPAASQTRPGGSDAPDAQQAVSQPSEQWRPSESAPAPEGGSQEPSDTRPAPSAETVPQATASAGPGTGTLPQSSGAGGLPGGGTGDSEAATGPTRAGAPGTAASTEGAAGLGPTDAGAAEAANLKSAELGGGPPALDSLGPATRAQGPGSDGSAAGATPDVLVAKTRYEVDFRGGDRDWRPRNARVEAAAANRTAGFPGVPFPRGYRVEPWDTRSPDQRERNLPMGRPRLVCETLAWDAELIDEIVVRAAFAGDGRARIYFRAHEPGAASGDLRGFEPDDFVETEVRGEEGMGSWIFRVSENPRWRGTVTGLRLDLVDRRMPYLIEGLRARQRVGSDQ